jgi:hypothetical protein
MPKLTAALAAPVLMAFGSICLCRYEKMCWPLYKKHGHAYEAFRRCVASDEEAKLIFAEFGLSESVRNPGIIQAVACA